MNPNPEVSTSSTFDLADWIPEKQAAERIGLSVRALFTRSGQPGGPQRALRPREGKKAEPVYHPDDVERLAAERRPKPHILPAHNAEHARADIAQATREIFRPDPFPHVLDAIAESIRAAGSRFLTVDQAAERSGLSRGFLVRLIRERQLAAVYDHGYKVRQRDVDALQLAPGFNFPKTLAR